MADERWLPFDHPAAQAARHRYEVHRRHVDAEAGHIATRLNWLLAFNSFLTVPYVLCLTADPTELVRDLREGLPVVGLVASLGTLLLVAVAAWVTRDLRKRFEEPPADPLLRLAVEEHAALVPDLVGLRWTYRVGLLVPVVLALGMSGAWALLVVAR